MIAKSRISGHGCTVQWILHHSFNLLFHGLHHMTASWVGLSGASPRPLINVQHSIFNRHPLPTITTMGVPGLWDVRPFYPSLLPSWAYGLLATATCRQATLSYQSRRCGWFRTQCGGCPRTPHWYRCQYLVLSRRIRTRRRESRAENSVLPMF